MAQCRQMAGPRKPTWMPMQCLRGVNSDIGRAGLNRAMGRSRLNRAIGRSGLNQAIGRSGLNHVIGRSGLNHVIGRLKSHRVESASWAMIPLISRDPTAKITLSEIRVVGHDLLISHILLYK